MTFLRISRHFSLILFSQGWRQKLKMFRMSSSLSFERAHLLAIGNIQIKCFTNACYKYIRHSYNFINKTIPLGRHLDLVQFGSSSVGSQFPLPPQTYLVRKSWPSLNLVPPSTENWIPSSSHYKPLLHFFWRFQICAWVCCNIINNMSV